MSPMSNTASPSVWWILVSSLGSCAPVGCGWRWHSCVHPLSICCSWTWYGGRMEGMGMKKCWHKVVPAAEKVWFPSRTDSILFLLVTIFMPGETLLVECYYYLWALMIGLLGKHKISLLRVFPAWGKETLKFTVRFIGETKEPLHKSMAQHRRTRGLIYERLHVLLLKYVVHPKLRNYV